MLLFRRKQSVTTATTAAWKQDTCRSTGGTQASIDASSSHHIDWTGAGRRGWRAVRNCNRLIFIFFLILQSRKIKFSIFFFFK